MYSYNNKNIGKNYNAENIDNISKHSSDQKERLPLKSVNGRRCLTKCHAKGEAYLHPILLTAIGERTNNSCAIEPVPSRAFETSSGDTQYLGLYGMVWADICRLDDNKTYQPPDELESMLLSFYFNPRDFLSGVYGLYSFDQVIYWTLENDHLPFDTIKRVHNCAWKVFGNKIEELSSSVIDYYFDISRSYWLKDYAKVIQNDYSFDYITSKSVGDISNATEDVYKILYFEFYTHEFFTSAIKRYVYEFEDKWELIDSHYYNLKKYVLLQLLEHIENITSTNRDTK
ncbi:hypothetical protein QJ856_gp0855 [Tupanvirus deep ocean]|uniref:Uncharacterized protein n=2 Tax=Tupanvirus TaxID=2094720 RepID=A0AC62A8A8_9VIRU|nr:hypothetical protein QJ856_gp0855 [Tupanvirus deep ocean]QKU33900.1 hypothetical protein [Tupanvirus deep ocean]